MSSNDKIITRACINSDLSLHIVDKELIFEYDELIELIDRAKTYLIKEVNVKAGDQVIITFGNYYTPWFYACAELGLVFVIAVSHKISNYKELNNRYGKIDHVIVPFDKKDLLEFTNTYKDTAIDANIIKTYQDTSKKDIKWANNSSILTRSISEKYTQKIRSDAIEEHSHEFYYRLLHRNGKLFKIDNNDRCMHTRILHHGTSLALFFLPAFKFCKNQFWCDDDNNIWPSYISYYGITRCIMFDTMIDNFIKYNRASSLLNLTIYTILSPSREQVTDLVVDKHASIISLFGMTSTSGPIFVQEINYNTHHLYDQTVFSDVLDDFYTVIIEAGKLVVQYDDKIVYTKDRFEYKNNKYHFLFRGNMIIGICGFIGSGKDTVADYLVNFHGFRRESFASSLKDAVSAIFGWDRVLLEGRTAESRKWREEPDEWWSNRLDMTITPRFVLQHWGTEILRHQFHPDIWIASVENKLRFSNDNIVITDCRFPNEIKALKEAGGIVVRIKRGPEPDWYKFAYDANIGKSGAADKLKYRKIHESEMSWIGPNIDVTIENDGTIDELYQSIKDLVQDPPVSK